MGVERFHVLSVRNVSTVPACRHSSLEHSLPAFTCLPAPTCLLGFFGVLEVRRLHATPHVGHANSSSAADATAPSAQ